MKKIIPLITRVCLRVGVWSQCNGFGFWVHKLLLLNNQSRATLWGPWNMSHGGISTFDSHFDYRLIVLKDIQHGTSTRIHCVGWNVVNVSWNGRWCAWIGWVVHVWLGSLQRVCPELFLGLFNPVRYGMKYFQSPNPKEWEREYRPCVKLHQEKWFQLLWNCAKLNSVSCTSNLLAPTCDFRKCTRVPPDVGFESSKSLAKTEFETIQVCIVVLCFPHNNIAGVHLSGFEHDPVIVHHIFAWLTFSLSSTQINMVKKWCWFSQIDVFI